MSIVEASADLTTYRSVGSINPLIPNRLNWRPVVYHEFSVRTRDESTQPAHVFSLHVQSKRRNLFLNSYDFSIDTEVRLL